MVIGMTTANDDYDEAHLFVAALRVLSHQKGAPPTVEEVSEMLSRSLDWSMTTARKLKEMGAITVAETPYSLKLFLGDHLKLEEISREKKESGFDREIENFQKSRQDLTRKVESIQAELAKKKQDLFADLEKKMKNKKD